MGIGKYASLNVLAQKNQNNCMSDDALTEVANLINTCGENRSQRRRLERSLRKVENITAHAQKHLDDSAYKEYQKRLDTNYLYFFSCLALTMADKYKWREDESHDQISSIIESVDKTISKYANQGYTAKQLADLVDKRFDIRLLPNVD